MRLLETQPSWGSYEVLEKNGDQVNAKASVGQAE